jgi:dihydrofolate synthase/folylpolyglutamate synthase
VNNPDWRGSLPQFSRQVRTKPEGSLVDFDPFGPVRVGLQGSHQIDNARIAICVIEALVEFETDLFGRSLSVTTEEVVRGLEKARHPGRLEYVDNFLLDGGHNPGGAKALKEFLEESERRSITLVFGAMRDKLVAEIAEILWPRAKRIILTQPSNSRALTADELAAFAPASLDANDLIRTETVAEAVEKAKEITPPDGLIVVTGSLYLVGEVKKLLADG